jgi:hypothetical protein
VRAEESWAGVDRDAFFGSSKKMVLFFRRGGFGGKDNVCKDIEPGCQGVAVLAGLGLGRAEAGKVGERVEAGEGEARA